VGPVLLLLADRGFPVGRGEGGSHDLSSNRR
jgi:hypothetical protein